MKDIENIKKNAKINDVPIMMDDGLDYMIDYIKNHEIYDILEIGTAVGYSAIKMAMTDKKVNVVTLERDEGRYQQAIVNIIDNNLDDRITVHLCDALEFETNQKFDMIFIDAAKAQYIRFFEKYSPNLKIDGVIFSDNLKFHGMVDSDIRIKNRNTRALVRKIRKYIEYLKENEYWETTFVDKGDGIALTKRKVL